MTRTIFVTVVDIAETCLQRSAFVPSGSADVAGRPDLETAQVALEPAATAIIDLNAATVQRTDGNRLTLADILRDDGRVLSSNCPQPAPLAHKHRDTHAHAKKEGAQRKRGEGGGRVTLFQLAFVGAQCWYYAQTSDALGRGQCRCSTALC